MSTLAILSATFIIKEFARNATDTFAGVHEDNIKSMVSFFGKMKSYRVKEIEELDMALKAMNSFKEDENTNTLPKLIKYTKDWFKKNADEEFERIFPNQWIQRVTDRQIILGQSVLAKFKARIAVLDKMQNFALKNKVHIRAMQLLSQKEWDEALSRLGNNQLALEIEPFFQLKLPT